MDAILKVRKTLEQKYSNKEIKEKERLILELFYKILKNEDFGWVDISEKYLTLDGEISINEHTQKVLQEIKNIVDATEE